MGFLAIQGRWGECRKNKVLQANQNSKFSNMAYCKLSGPIDVVTVQTPWRIIQSPDTHLLPFFKHKHQGKPGEILDIMAPLVIKLFESPYLCSVSWETPPSPSPELGAVPLFQAWEHCKKAVTRDWTAGETSQQHQNEVGGRNMEQGQKHASSLE